MKKFIQLHHFEKGYEISIAPEMVARIERGQSNTKTGVWLKGQGYLYEVDEQVDEILSKCGKQHFVEFTGGFNSMPIALRAEYIVGVHSETGEKCDILYGDPDTGVKVKASYAEVLAAIEEVAKA